MKIKTTHTNFADQLSAKVFFKALAELYAMKDWTVLDAFARNGELTVANYLPHVQKENLECWELGDEHTDALNALTDRVVIGCSYETATQYPPGQQFDMVVVDTPQGVHHDYQMREMTEHFDFLPLAAGLLKDEAVLVLYVNKHPYDKDEVGSHGYDEYREYNYGKWMDARAAFYGTETVTEGQALTTYTKMLEAYGFEVLQTLMVPCFSDVAEKDPYAFRIALSVRRQQ